LSNTSPLVFTQSLATVPPAYVKLDTLLGEEYQLNWSLISRMRSLPGLLFGFSGLLVPPVNPCLDLVMTFFLQLGSKHRSRDYKSIKTSG
jgi:hypothetical protein